MKVGDNVLVYGTLKQGHGAHDYLKGRSEFIGDRRISGRLYNLGWFPGLKVEGTEFVSEGPTVKGELYRITDENLPKMLDRYEGFPNLYSRAEVQTENGETTWVYTYNGECNEEKLVPSGEWGRE